MEGETILYHLRTQGTGSEGVHIRGLVTAFREAGFNVDFLWFLGEGDPTHRAGDNPYETKKRKSSLELLIPLIPSAVFAFLEVGYNLWSYLKLKSLVKSKQYAFVYERHFYFSFASGMIARKYNIPLVVEVNELAGLERVRENRLTGLAKRCERSLFANASIICVVSKFLKDKIASSYPDIDTGKIHVIPNGVTRDTFLREYDGHSVRKRFGIDDRVVFGFVGFFLKASGWHAFDWFLPAFIEAVKDTPEIVLMLVGDGPGRSDIEDTCRSLGFEDRLIITGIIPNKEIGDYIDAMDIGTVPHTNEYRSPIKMFEYMAFGKPILAPDEEPVTHIIGDIQGDYLFKAKSEKSLIDAIGRIMDDRQSWTRIGRELKDLVRSELTYEKHGETILRFLNQMQKT